MFAENLVWLAFLHLIVCFLYKNQSQPTIFFFAVGKSGSNAAFNLIFFGLGSPSVGEFVRFIIPGNIFFPNPTEFGINRGIK